CLSDDWPAFLLAERPGMCPPIGRPERHTSKTNSGYFHPSSAEPGVLHKTDISCQNVSGRSENYKMYPGGGRQSRIRLPVVQKVMEYFFGNMTGWLIALVAAFAISSPARYEEHFLNFDHIERRYLLHLPPGWTQKSSAPVIFMLHGGGGS